MTTENGGQPVLQEPEGKATARASRRSRLKALEEKLGEATRERDELAQKVRELSERVATLEDEKLRLMAEMDNMHKRLQRRLEEDRWLLVAELARPLLEVSDNLQRAIQAAGGMQESTVEGIRMVHSQLQEVLARYGVTPIEAVGKPFDFALHEAIAQVPAEPGRENEVVQELSKGYLLNGRLLRPSRVVVARAVEAGEE